MTHLLLINIITALICHTAAQLCFCLFSSGIQFTRNEEVSSAVCRVCFIEARCGQMTKGRESLSDRSRDTIPMVARA